MCLSRGVCYATLPSEVAADCSVGFVCLWLFLTLNSELRRGNVCGLASVALKGGPGLGRWAGFDAVYAPLIIEAAENVEMSYKRGPRRSRSHLT